MKQIQRGEYLIQEVHKYARNFEVSPTGHWLIGFLTVENLPKKHKWQIVEVTEEVAREIVESAKTFGYKKYDAVNGEYQWVSTAFESYHSLLRSLEIEFENHKLLKKIV